MDYSDAPSHGYRPSKSRSSVTKKLKNPAKSLWSICFGLELLFIAQKDIIEPFLQKNSILSFKNKFSIFYFTIFRFCDYFSINLNNSTLYFAWNMYLIIALYDSSIITSLRWYNLPLRPNFGLKLQKCHSVTKYFREYWALYWCCIFSFWIPYDCLSW